MSENPEYSPTMSREALLAFRDARDAAINGRLSALVEQAARDGMNTAPTQGMINPLGQVATVRSPVDSGRIHPVYRTRRPHHGTDLVPSNGSRESPVIAAADGYLLYVGAYSRDAGQTVLIYHPNGPDGPYVTGYMHLREGSLTTRALGSRVAQGERIGDMSDTGVGTGPHLHFVVRKLNPRPEDMPLIEHSTNRGTDDGGVVSVAPPPADPSRFFGSYTVVRPRIDGILYSAAGQEVPWVPLSNTPAPTPEMIANVDSNTPEPAAPTTALPDRVTGGENCVSPSAPCHTPRNNLIGARTPH